MTTELANARNFLEINGLNSIRQQSRADDEGAKQAALKEAAKQFEGIFTQMLLKSMRSAQDVLESDSPFNSQSTKFYRDMHDQQLALELSANGSLGLSDLIVRQLGGSDNFTPSSVIRGDGQLDSRHMGNTNVANVAANVANKAEQFLAAEQVSKNRQVDIPLAAASNNTAQTERFEQPQDFVTALTEPAKMVEKKLGVPFEVVIAQAALETGWGQKIIQTQEGQSSNNLFNIKADSRWQGESATKDTLEFEQGAMVKKSAPFRVYQSLTESAQDYINFLSNNDRYQATLEKSGDVEQFLHSLQKAGYATDPNYANKILGTMRKVTSLLNN
ncbi:flagellar assembly peptidoglycan hydrolase FlgJ [Thalassomonas actiniarum]|uniref:Peptidoglycan hydrolase FlgJ n=1 Tax=Thalassomonas actiniarum TaxID=485447 RepID=A0AAE9YSL3_9GAMM|nr:flagellar assembly peptidoglycan hydrolase FlgJ [Thalassomonas actiniarum]WDE00475.1 flagellar assembly peptidoglycan hydrolase FlgJ [Thalassomonas actiniarum]